MKDESQSRPPSSDLDGSAVARARLAAGGRWQGTVHVRAETGSTNDDAKHAAACGAPAGETFVADHQRAGRGRQGRVWHGPPGASLLVSVVVRPRLAPNDLPPLSLAAGLAVADAVAPRLGGRRVEIKWPNDVVVDGRKLAGILVEASLTWGAVSWGVVGVGINVRAASRPPELAAAATCLEACGATGSALDRTALLADVLTALERRVDALEAGGFAALADELRGRDGARGRRAFGDAVRGVAAGIADDGRLLVLTDEGPLIAVSAGEVRLGPIGGT